MPGAIAPTAPNPMCRAPVDELARAYRVDNAGVIDPATYALKNLHPAARVTQQALPLPANLHPHTALQMPVVLLALAKGGDGTLTIALFAVLFRGRSPVHLATLVPLQFLLAILPG